MRVVCDLRLTAVPTAPELQRVAMQWSDGESSFGTVASPASPHGDNGATLCHTGPRGCLTIPIYSELTVSLCSLHGASAPHVWKRSPPLQLYRTTVSCIPHGMGDRGYRWP